MENEQTQLDLDKIVPQKSEGIDLSKHDKKETTISNVKVIQVPSKFTPFIKDENGEDTEEHQKQWALRVESEILETIEKDDGSKAEFRASELFNLVQDKEGNLTGFPSGEGSNLMKFMTDLNIETEKIENLNQVIEHLKGKKVLIKSYKKNDKTFLKFRY